MKIAIIKFRLIKNLSFNTYIYYLFTYYCYSVLYVFIPLTVTNTMPVRIRKMNCVE